MRFTTCIVACAAAGLLACGAVGPVPPAPTAAEGFVPFLSARDFDPPGRIYRVDQGGTVYGVATLRLEPLKGSEALAKVERKSNFSLGEVLELTGAKALEGPASLKAEVSKVREFTLQSTQGNREYLDDGQVDKALPEALRTIVVRPGNRYYLIRETISTSNLSYSSDKSWAANLGLQAPIEAVLSSNTSLKWDDSTKFSIDAKFPAPMRVWYKPEVLKIERPMGAGPGQLPIVTRTSVGVGETVRLVPNAPMSP